MNIRLPGLVLLFTLVLACQGGSSADVAAAPENSSAPLPVDKKSLDLKSLDLNRFPEATWLATSEELHAELSSQPIECLNKVAYAHNTYQLTVGKAAFNTPSVLGGQAARMGISCNTCHRSGQTNPRFFIAGVSAQPGGLDVSHGFFSEVREDGIFNPVPIPSLLDARNKSVFGTQLPQYSLAAFVHGVIVDEFAGHEPAPQIMSALLAYISALDSSSCNSSAQIARNLQSDLNFVEQLAVALNTALVQQQAPVTQLLVTALQTRLHDIYLRYQGNNSLQSALEQASRELRNLERKSQQGQIAGLQEWDQHFQILRTKLLATSNSVDDYHP